MFSFRILVTWQFIPICIRRDFTGSFDPETCNWLQDWINAEVFIFDTCEISEVDAKSLESAVYKASKIISASWESCWSELHSTQRLRRLGRYVEIDDSSWELLRGASKGTRDDMTVDVWNWDGRLFVGDIQDQMMDGNTSRDNPS